MISPRSLFPAENSAHSIDDVDRAVLQAVVNHSPALIAYLDTEHRYRFANAAFRLWYGLDPADMIGRTVAEVFGERAAERSRMRFARILSGESLRIETQITTLKGARVVEAYYVLDGNEEGVAQGFHVTVNDITDRIRTTHALGELTALQTAILDNANLAIFSTDAEGVIWSFNSTAEGWLGYRLEELIGQGTPALFCDAGEMDARYRELARLLPQRPLATLLDWVLAVTEARGAVYDEREWTMVRRDGSRFPTMLSLTPLRDPNGEPSGILGVARDITTEKAAKMEQRRAREVAEEASRAKSHFLANMSHEVRTPLHGMMGVAGMLLETPLDAQQKTLAETLHASAQALFAVVTRVLDYSKVEAGKLELERIDFSLRELVAEIVQLHSFRAAAKGVELTWEVTPTAAGRMTGDADRLRQIIHNLVGNAVKFSHRGAVRVQVEPVSTGDAAKVAAGWVQLRFRVTDEGIGIEPEAQGRIFEAFTQADDSVARRFGGTGLGLAIARQLVGLMGGEMGVESSPGEGATFWFTASFRQSTSAALCPARSATREVSPDQVTTVCPLRVLLAEDCDVNRLAARHQLEALGCVVTVAETGPAAVVAAQQSDFDLVLMDGRLPGLDGYAAAAAIRADETKGRRSRIVALTALVSDGERERCLAAGMDEYLAKPFSPPQLAAVVRAVALLLLPPTAVSPLGSRQIAVLRAEPAVAGEPLLSRLSRVFQREAPEVLAALERGLEQSDPCATELAAHKLKGAAGNFGAARIEQLCTVVEELCQTNGVRFVHWLTPELQKEVPAVARALGELSPALLSPGDGGILRPC